MVQRYTMKPRLWEEMEVITPLHYWRIILNAEEFQNYTHVDGIFTANPDLVVDAKKNRAFIV